jgi:hypothetical protein
VAQNGSVATLQHLITGRVKPSVHVKDCRIINPPVSAEQVEEWEKLLGQDEVDGSRKYFLSSAPLLRGEVDEPVPESQQRRVEVFDLDPDDEDELEQRPGES